MLRRSDAQALPECGSVGGVDIGWSQKRASSAVARLDWDAVSARVVYQRFRATERERTDTIRSILNKTVLAVALDGPLSTGLQPLANYRFAERLLTAGFQPHIGKPGQTNSPNGLKLNSHATGCARLLVASGVVERANHPERIHSRAVVEAFPTSFLGVLIPQPAGLKVKKRASSDVFYEELTRTGALDGLLTRLLPERVLEFSFADIRNHDDRAAVICALTSLCIAAGDYTAVGDNDGWIVLPPFDLVASWAHDIFAGNAEKIAKAGVLPKLGRKLGMAAFMYPAMSLEEFNAADREIAALFHGSADQVDSRP